MHKPPLLLLHEDVESVEFCRQGGGGAASTKTFDLAIRDRQDQVGALFKAAPPADWVRGIDQLCGWPLLQQTTLSSGRQRRGT